MLLTPSLFLRAPFGMVNLANQFSLLQAKLQQKSQQVDRLGRNPGRLKYTKNTPQQMHKKEGFFPHKIERRMNRRPLKRSWNSGRGGYKVTRRNVNGGGRIPHRARGSFQDPVVEEEVPCVGLQQNLSNLAETGNEGSSVPFQIYRKSSANQIYGRHSWPRATPCPR